MTFGCVIRLPQAAASNRAVGIASPAYPPMEHPIPEGINKREGMGNELVKILFA
ncbi:Hypothetical protein P9211_15671 [Prochlorococcus marinus str. MIT 9211]|uniref:Uncharacterized protein n=1 Tax=Prochlorococcus marinus (strain MIT 9211) TaxID=93059 RepID=A9BCD6_PROM4|nr:Hypothetical protein P9211_15671 [Prochlorococcus marinus str. MIT 9211]